VHLDDRRLAELSDEVDQLHHESMKTVEQDLAEVHFGEVAGQLRDARRRFLSKSLVGGAAITAGSMVMPISRFLPAAFAADTPSDADLAKFAQSLELAAVAAYKAAAATGKLSAPVSDVASVFQGHHQDHADAFAAILGDAAVTKPNKGVLAAFAPKIKSAADEKALLEIAYTIEEAAAATYYSALGVVKDQKAAGALATILPVESQHAVVLATALGKPASTYLIDFQDAQNALSPDKYPVS
jgi:rubrerythrin